MSMIPRSASSFDLSETQRESMAKPDGVANEFGGETKTTVAECVDIHHVSLSNPGQLDNTLNMLYLFIK